MRALVLMVVAAAACDRSTTIRVTIDGPSVSSLALTVKLSGRNPLTKTLGQPRLPGAVVLVMSDVAQPVDLSASAIDATGAHVTAQASVVTVAHAEVAAYLALGGNTAADLAGGIGGDLAGLSAADLATSSADLATNLLARDTFIRPNQSGWGTASDGQVWGGDATGSGFTISGNVGALDCTALGSDDAAVLGPSVADVNLLVRASDSNYADSNIEAAVRVQDNRNFYRSAITGGKLTIEKIVGGTSTWLNSITWSANNGSVYNLRVLVTGTSLSARAWSDGAPEPSTWLVTATDSTYASGRFGITSNHCATPATYAFSYLEATRP